MQPAADVMPEPFGKKLGAIVYIHGWQGSAQAVMRFSALTKVAKELGVFLIAPQGLDKSWSIPKAFEQKRDDVAFIENVIEDSIRRFPIDRSKIMISGFSLGGSMTWYIACARGNKYAGYAPIAGAFWLPYPQSCKAPISNLFHVHGLKDKMVPMKGRQVTSSARQGDVLHSFRMLAKVNNCKTKPIDLPENSSLTPAQNLKCHKASCQKSFIELCLHDGGHSVKPQWIVRAWKMLQQKNGWKS
ncbi:MAG: polyhydroxybutyrate depolymerase [Pseudomonadota bacterium]